MLLVPGNAFFPGMVGGCPYVRAAYSTASVADIDTALSRLGELLRANKKKNLGEEGGY